MALPSFSFTPPAILNDIIFGINLLTGSLRIDVVGIFNGTSLQQMFTDARPVKAFVREQNKIMDYPVETGVTLSDHKVQLQKQIEMSLIIPAAFYSSTYQQIVGAATNSTLLTVQTRAGVYPNMIIEAYPHEEDPSMYDAITMGLRLREVLFVAPVSIAQPNAPAGYSPIDQVLNNTVRRGQQAISQAVALPAAVLGYVRTLSAWGLI
jgi:hypothetical protein